MRKHACIVGQALSVLAFMDGVWLASSKWPCNASATPTGRAPAPSVRN